MHYYSWTPFFEILDPPLGGDMALHSTPAPIPILWSTSVHFMKVWRSAGMNMITKVIHNLAVTVYYNELGYSPSIWVWVYIILLLLPLVNDNYIIDKVKISVKTTSLALYKILWPQSPCDITGTFVASALWRPILEEAVYFPTLWASLNRFYNLILNNLN